MLTSLPPIVPRDAHTRWSSASASTSLPDSHASQYPRRTPQSRNPVLAALDAEEEAILARKANVRRFGATWLRPPGISKTYQAMVDEAAERAEQEAIARREAALAEEQQAAEEEARRVRMMHGGGTMDLDGEDDEAGVMERDLDEEVPEADEEGSEDSELEEHDFGLDGTRDLDDDVPDAGSYEHTDTDLEDSSDEDAGTPAQMAEEHVTPEYRGASSAGTGGGARGPTVVQNMTMALPPPAPRSGASSSHGDLHSSMLVSSPTMARQPRRARQAPMRSWAGGPATRSSNNENERSGG